MGDQVIMWWWLFGSIFMFFGVVVFLAYSKADYENAIEEGRNKFIGGSIHKNMWRTATEDFWGTDFAEGVIIASGFVIGFWPVIIPLAILGASVYYLIRTIFRLSEHVMKRRLRNKNDV